MEQQDTYIPNEDRTLEELCQDINLRAEKVYLLKGRKDKTILLIGIVVILGILALVWYFLGFEINWNRDPFVIAAIVGWCFVYTLINKLLINRMKRATSPKQHLRFAKCLKWWDKFSKAIVPTMIIPSIWLSQEDGVNYGILLLIFIPLFILFFIIARVDEDFSEGLDELEYRLQECVPPDKG